MAGVGVPETLEGLFTAQIRQEDRGDAHTHTAFQMLFACNVNLALPISPVVETGLVGIMIDGQLAGVLDRDKAFVRRSWGQALFHKHSFHRPWVRRVSEHVLPRRIPRLHNVGV